MCQKEGSGQIQIAQNNDGQIGNENKNEESNVQWHNQSHCHIIFVQLIFFAEIIGWNWRIQMKSLWGIKIIF
jgi:hypothetical protein